MRTTLSLDDDVAALIERIRKSRNASLKEIVNTALWEGLVKMTTPSGRREIFRTKALSVGHCRFPNLDNVAEVLAIAEGDQLT